MRNRFSKLVVVPMVLMLAACGGGGDLNGLRDKIEETKRRPGKQIEPLPVFRPLPPFAYAAMTLRSPFERPIEELASVKGGKTVEPDLSRPKEYLENFSITNMSMVGTVEQNGTLWALVDTGPGSQRSVEPVTIGNYMGRNHGKIITASPNQIEVMEIVADGDGGWVERPRIIKLEEKE
ncbi:pilus assembly protein PilP [Gilvimarinus sp. SDUM040013]|uniref:Pilus assembly protein PilP n=1 Tax=Gilvimarinus gilvus TaxID=3058038 RepID=A0ABU4S3J7_9GAMM|nr:pilus assembly protein PilP [Gilvimarinus sp. SDUM040013]MDO3387387.1 pilus assembly protein PilP [Gilvimarinus sp. SDUM040013]MDX6849864.1 pilus assembly protein PilP [Gilvimarinus sp. SDUM040013]